MKNLYIASLIVSIIIPEIPPFEGGRYQIFSSSMRTNENIADMTDTKIKRMKSIMI